MNCEPVVHSVILLKTAWWPFRTSAPVILKSHVNTVMFTKKGVDQRVRLLKSVYLHLRSRVWCEFVVAILLGWCFSPFPSSSPYFPHPPSLVSHYVSSSFLLSLSFSPNLFISLVTVNMLSYNQIHFKEFQTNTGLMPSWHCGADVLYRAK